VGKNSERCRSFISSTGGNERGWKQSYGTNYSSDIEGVLKQLEDCGFLNILLVIGILVTKILATKFFSL